MNQLTARIISYVLQPLFMPFLTVLMAFYIDPYVATSVNGEGKFGIMGVMALNTFLVPTLLIVYLKYIRIISSLDVEKRRERYVPFIVTLVLYIITYVLFRKSPIPEIVYSLMLASILAMLLAFLITFTWKISIHMTGIGGVIGAMVALFELHMFFPVGVLCALILIAGFIGTARLTLGVHTLAQVICGTFLGFVTQYISVRYGLVI